MDQKKNLQNKKRSDKRMENIEHNMYDIDDTMERANLLNSRTREEGENRKETIAKKIIAENFLILMKDSTDMRNVIGWKKKLGLL